MTDLKQIKEQMRREHRKLKFRKFVHNRAVLIGATVTSDYDYSGVNSPDTFSL